MADLRMALDSLRVAAVLVLALLPAATKAQQAFETVEPGKLTACFPRNSGVLAGQRSTGGSGFDYRMMEEVASRLDLILRPVWFEAELDEESDPLRETYAMLSHGLCDVVPGHPRYVRAVGRPGFNRAKLPRWVGMPQALDRDTQHIREAPVGFVDVETIAVSRGYMRSTIGLLYRDGERKPRGLDDLGGRSLAFQQGTLSGAIAMTQVSAEDRQLSRHFNPGPSFLWIAETEGLETVIVDVTAFDTYRMSNPGTRYRLASWRHPLGMDIGTAVLERNDAMLHALDVALAEILETGQAEIIASDEGMTYAPPLASDLAPDITMRDLASTR